MQVLVGGEGVGHELLELAVGHRRGGVELDDGDGHLARTLVGRPKTAESSTAGWPCSTASSSAGATWKPLTLIISLERSVRCTQPSGSSQPTSPVRYQPSTNACIGGGGVREVAGHGRGAADLDFPDLAGGEHLAGVEVRDPQLHAVGGQAGGVAKPLRVGAVDRVAGDDRHLAGAVGGEPGDTRALGHRLGDALGHGVAPHMM